MCGRRKLEKDYPELCNFGDMDLDLAIDISKQLPEDIVVQFHSNGEPLLYPRLGPVLARYDKQIKCLNTNAKLLFEKRGVVIDSLDTLTISVIENDPEGDEQYKIVKEFVEFKGDRKPFMIYRLLGDVNCSVLSDRNDNWRKDRWYKLPGIIATRILHSPMGSFNYTKKVTIPEVGFCQDLFSHLVIDRFGDVYPCVRFDPTKINKLGNIKESTLEELWNSEKRLDMLKEHIKGNRNCSELCSKCHFYGIPRGE
jgi:radical SAM protein with 4Fe4S-binding SPASM domain